MSADELARVNALALAKAIRCKQLSPVEVTQSLLGRIEAFRETINAFATVIPEHALSAARAAETKVMRSEELGPLHGVPFTVKDLVVTKGVRTAFGSRLRQDFVPRDNAPAVERLEQAGAILIGKTTTSEFGWTAKGVSPLTAVTRNPWHTEFDAGGSSAGAAAAAAAGMCPLHLATDGAGSIRIPAHFCGVFGFKPSYGLVPQFPVSANDNTTHIGPIARSVEDAALMLRVMAGLDPRDHTSSAAPVPDYAALLANPMPQPRIAYSADLGHARVDAEIADIVAAAAGALEKSGLHVEEVTPPFGPRGPELIRFFWPAHLSRFTEVPPDERSMLDHGLLACAEAGIHSRVADYQRMRELKYDYCAAIGRFFEDWDFLLTPSASVAAFAPDRLQPLNWPQHPWDWFAWAEFSYPFNFSGNPAASVACGLTAAGLPVGLQIVGKRFNDLGVLQLAACIEAMHPFVPPPTWTSRTASS